LCLPRPSCNSGFDNFQYCLHYCGHRYVLADKWAVGSVLDKLELNAMLKFIIETNMGKLNQQKFDKEMRNPIYKNHVVKTSADCCGIRFEEGQVIVNIKSPVQLLSSQWVVLEGSRKGKGKNRITQYRIESYLV
jgi:hypothetical protein